MAQPAPTTTATSRFSTPWIVRYPSGGRRRCWRWTTTTPACARRWSSRECRRWYPGGSRGIRLAADGDARAGAAVVTVDRRQAAHRVDAEHLELGGGLEVLLAAAFERVAPGGVLEIRTPSRAVALELPGWARLAGHEPIDQTSRPDGHVVVIRRGPRVQNPGCAAPTAGRSRTPSSRRAPYRRLARRSPPARARSRCRLRSSPSRTRDRSAHTPLASQPPRRDLGRRRRRARRPGVRPAVGRVPRHPLGRRAGPG